jgi:hypothetical protein
MREVSRLPLDLTEVLYRGEFAHPDTPYVASRGKALYFGSVDIANRYAEPGHPAPPVEHTARVYPVRLEMHNPFINQPQNTFLELSEMYERFGLEEALRIARKFHMHIENTCHWTERINGDGRWWSVCEYLKANPENVKSLYFNAYRFLADDAEVERLKILGFDGAIHMGNGYGSALQVEYCVFYYSRIRSIFE